MRYCCRGMCTDLRISEACHFIWRWQPFVSAPHKTVTVRLHPFDLRKYSSITNITRCVLRAKLGQTQKRTMDSFVWTNRCKLTCKDLHQLCADTECSLVNLVGVMDDRDGRERDRKRDRESQRNPWLQHDLMIYVVHSISFQPFLYGHLKFSGLPFFFFRRTICNKILF